MQGWVAILSRCNPSTGSDRHREEKEMVSGPREAHSEYGLVRGERYTNRWLKTWWPVTTDFWSVSRRKQVTLCGGVWKHVLSEACWMIAWRSGGGGECPWKTQQVRPVAGGRPSAFWKLYLECGMDDGRGEEGWEAGQTHSRWRHSSSIHRQVLFSTLSPHVFITGVQVTSIFFPLYCVDKQRILCTSTFPRN